MVSHMYFDSKLIRCYYVTLTTNIFKVLDIFHDVDFNYWFVFVITNKEWWISHMKGSKEE